MIQGNIKDSYFQWLCNLVCKERFSKVISYKKLLILLHDTRFTCRIRRDSNRANDGFGLRWRFTCKFNDAEVHYEKLLSELTGLCSVLEMMVALALRMEENIMDDPSVGNRTQQWFWGMITNMGLGSMTDDRFDENRVKGVIDSFLRRRYEPDGRGGLFTVKDCECDLREVEIWQQMCWYINTMI